MSEADPTDETDSSDPASIRLPFVQTAATIKDDVRVRDAWVFLPFVGALMLFPAVYFGLGVGPFESLLSYVAMAFVTILASLFSTAVASESKWHTPPTEKARGRVRNVYDALVGRFPMGRDETLKNTHNVKRAGRTEKDGHVITKSGRRKQLVGVLGPNTDYMAQRAKDELSAAVGGGADDELNERAWAWVARSRPHSAQEVRDLREENARPDAETRNSELQKRVLRDVNEKTEERDKARRPCEFLTYVAVTAHPNELRGSFMGGEDGRTVEELLEERVKAVEDAFAGVENADTVRVDTEEHVREAASYWRPGEEYDDELLDAFENESAEGYTAAERLLAPGHFDVDGDVVELGEGTVARTFWFEELPLNPDSLLHSALYTKQNVDISVKSYHTPRDRGELKDELEQIYPYVADEANDIQNDGRSLKSITASTPRKAVINAYAMLDAKLTEAWDYSGFVTIRAGSRKELEQATRRVKKTLSQAGTAVKADTGHRQYLQFLSASPFGQDVYGEKTEGQKTHTVLSGVLGAVLPAVSRTLYEPGGVRWGRSTQTWQNVVMDFFERGISPHGFTIGTSRSGKTFSVAQVLAEWWLEATGRTVIVFDTQGGFEGLTKLLEGDHYKLGSKEPFNPLAGANESTAEKLLESILHEFSNDPRPYMPAVSEAVRISRVEVKSDSSRDIDTWNLGDVLKVLLRMQKNPEAFTFDNEHADDDGAESAGETRKERVDELLEKLSCLRGEGKYSHFVTKKRGRIRAGKTDMAYIDGSNLRDSDDAEKSVNLIARIMQVETLVHETSDDVVFLGDEAHVLLQGHLVEWLQKAYREFARDHGVLWMVSQSPQDFLRAMQGTSENEENHRRTLVTQSAFVQVFRCSDMDNPELLRELGFNEKQIKRVTQKLTTGWSGKGYSECFMRFSDVNGWVEVRVQAAESLARAITYEPEHGEFYGGFWNYVFADTDEIVPIDVDEDDWIEEQLAAGRTARDFGQTAPGAQTAQTALADGGN